MKKPNRAHTSLLYVTCDSWVNGLPMASPFTDSDGLITKEYTLKVEG